MPRVDVNAAVQVASRPSSNMIRNVFPLHVIGAGSIGLLYASRIQQAYNKKLQHSNRTNVWPAVTLLMRPHHEPFLIRDTSTRQLLAPVRVSTHGESTKCDLPVEIIGQSSEEMSPINTLLLCTKANHACAAISSVWKRLQCSEESSPRIIILSNGALAIKDTILKHFPAARDVDIIYGSTTHGSYKNDNIRDEYCVQYTGKGSTHCVDADFINMCKESGFNGFEMTEFDMNVMLWKKLAVNCVANPLTAIHNVRNDELLGLRHDDQDIRQIIIRLLEEVSYVAMKEIESISAKCPHIEKDSVSSVHDELSVQSLETFVARVLTDTATNISSMLQDVRAQRETEIEFLNGYICRIGKEKYGYDCPHNQSMCSAVEKVMKIER